MGEKQSAIASKPADTEGVKNFVHCTSLRERGLTRSAAKRRHGKVNRVCLHGMDFIALGSDVCIVVQRLEGQHEWHTVCFCDKLVCIGTTNASSHKDQRVAAIS